MSHFSDEEKSEIQKMKDAPWDYGNLRDCAKCGSDDLEIFETDDGKFNFQCTSVTCNKCGKEVIAIGVVTADKLWGRSEKGNGKC